MYFQEEVEVDWVEVVSVRGKSSDGGGSLVEVSSTVFRIGSVSVGFMGRLVVVKE